MPAQGKVSKELQCEEEGKQGGGVLALVALTEDTPPGQPMTLLGL